MNQEIHREQGDPRSRVLKRFIKNMGILILVMFSLWALWEMYAKEAPGDYATREGDIRLTEGNYEEALASFNRALRERPNHRGALMGRALVFIKTKQYDKATAELTYLIDYLRKNLEPDDPTGVGLMAAAYANRGIVHDTKGRYKEALADYIEALRTDQGALDGPGIIDKVIYGTPNPSTVRGRAIYLKEQLALPPEKRLLRVPEIDAEQRMHKP